MSPTSSKAPDSGSTKPADFGQHFRRQHGDTADKERLARIGRAAGFFRWLISRLSRPTPEEFGDTPLHLVADDSILMPSMHELKQWINMDRFSRLNIPLERYLQGLKHIFKQASPQNSQKYPRFLRPSKPGFYQLTPDEHRIVMCLPFVAYGGQDVTYEKMMYLRGMDGSHITLYMGQTNDPVDPEFRAAIELKLPEIIVS